MNMLKYNTMSVAKELNIQDKELEKRSLKSFLERELLVLKTEFLILAFKYNLGNVDEFEKAVKKGKIRETEDTREDFFKLDYLENRTELVENLLNKI